MFATPLASCAQRAQSSNAICRSKFERAETRPGILSAAVTGGRRNSRSLTRGLRDQCGDGILEPGECSAPRVMGHAEPIFRNNPNLFPAGQGAADFHERAALRFAL
jgi:hypothetical protein